MSNLFKKIVHEFDAMPPNSLFGLILADGPYDPSNENSEQGKMCFGITPWNAGAEATNTDI